MFPDRLLRHDERTLPVLHLAVHVRRQDRLDMQWVDLGDWVRDVWLPTVYAAADGKTKSVGTVTMLYAVALPRKKKEG